MQRNIEEDDLYSELQEAFDFYNAELFGGELPRCIITLQRGKNTCGYFSRNRFVSAKESKQFRHEIAMNPEYFSVRPVEETLSTLVHEMCHLMIWEKTKKENKGYHGKDWVLLMERCGLIPSDTGRPGGRKTGYQMDHYIQKDGLFMTVTKKLCDGKYMLSWYDRFFNGRLKLCYINDIDIPADLKEKMLAEAKTQHPEKEDIQISTGGRMDIATGTVVGKRSGVRIKYSCGCCSVWGKSGLKMTCNLCGREFIEQSREDFPQAGEAD